MAKNLQPQVHQMPQSPLRNATNFHQHEIHHRNVISPAADKENASPSTPRSASGLFDNIRFTPQTETKNRGESKLEFLASLPTPVASKREDIILSESAPRKNIKRNLYEAEIEEIDEIEIVINEPGQVSYLQTLEDFLIWFSFLAFPRS